MRVPPGPRLRVWTLGAGADPTRVGAADDPCGGTYRHFPGEKGKRDDAWEWTAPASAGLGCIAAPHFLFILVFVSHVYTASISCLHLYYCLSALHRIHYNGRDSACSALCLERRRGRAPPLTSAQRGPPKPSAQAQVKLVARAAASASCRRLSA